MPDRGRLQGRIWSGLRQRHGHHDGRAGRAEARSGAPVDGWFGATLPVPSEQPQDVRALACLGEACRARVVSAGTAP